jgi:hypothetical protein
VGMVVRTGDRTVMGRIANLASSKIHIFKRISSIKIVLIRFGNG